MSKKSKNTDTAIAANLLLSGVVSSEKYNYGTQKPNEDQAVRLFLNPWKNNPTMDVIYHADNCQYDAWNMIEAWSPIMPS